MCERASALLLAIALLDWAPRAARAYPSSVMFAPSGDVLAPGQVVQSVWGSMNHAPVPGPGSWWITNQVGLLPRFEIGLDAHTSDLQGSPRATKRVDDKAYVKTLVNAKVQLLVEAGAVPNLSLGLVIAPFHQLRSPNVLFVSTSKSLSTEGTSLGTITLGLATFQNKDRSVFNGTAPFFQDTRQALIAGYESPSLGPLSFALDHVGGVSEISSTNAALVITPVEIASVTVGAFFGNDRRQPETRFVGLFAEVVIAWTLLSRPSL